MTDQQIDEAERKSLLDDYNDLVEGRQTLQETRDLLHQIEETGENTAEKINRQGERTSSWGEGMFGNYNEIKKSEKLIDRIDRRITKTTICKILLALILLGAIGTIIYFAFLKTPQ